MLDDRVGVAFLLLCGDTLATFSDALGDLSLGFPRDSLLNSAEKVWLRVWLRVLGAMLSMVCDSRYLIEIHVERNHEIG